MHFIRVIASRYYTTKKDRYGHWYGPFNNMKDFVINGYTDLNNEDPRNPDTHEYDEVEMSWLDYSKNEARVRQHLRQVFELLSIPDIETALQKVKIEKDEYFYKVDLYFVPNGDLEIDPDRFTGIRQEESIIMQLEHLRYYLTDSDFMNFIETHNLTDFYNEHKERIDRKGIPGPAK